jgi:hypothetical protein
VYAATYTLPSQLLRVAVSVTLQPLFHGGAAVEMRVVSAHMKLEGGLSLEGVDGNAAALAVGSSHLFLGTESSPGRIIQVQGADGLEW